jgi:hypothetical protein
MSESKSTIFFFSFFVQHSNCPIEKSKTKLEMKTEMFLAAVLRSHPRENFQKFSLPSSVNTSKLSQKRPFIPSFLVRLFKISIYLFFFLSVGFSLVRTPFQLGLYNNENISDLSGKKTRRKFLW